jgi:hypothetical protein
MKKYFLFIFLAGLALVGGARLSAAQYNAPISIIPSATTNITSTSVVLHATYSFGTEFVNTYALYTTAANSANLNTSSANLVPSGYQPAYYGSNYNSNFVYQMATPASFVIQNPNASTNGSTSAVANIPITGLSPSTSYAGRICGDFITFGAVVKHACVGIEFTTKPSSTSGTPVGTPIGVPVSISTGASPVGSGTNGVIAFNAVSDAKAYAIRLLDNSGSRLNLSAFIVVPGVSGVDVVGNKVNVDIKDYRTSSGDDFIDEYNKASNFVVASCLDTSCDKVGAFSSLFTISGKVSPVDTAATVGVRGITSIPIEILEAPLCKAEPRPITGVDGAYATTPSGITSSSATLNGFAANTGLRSDLSSAFIYGKTTGNFDYLTTPYSSLPAFATANASPVQIAGLTPNTNYKFALIVKAGPSAAPAKYCKSVQLTFKTSGVSVPVSAVSTAPAKGGVFNKIGNFFRNIFQRQAPRSVSFSTDVISDIFEKLNDLRSRISGEEVEIVNYIFSRLEGEAGSQSRKVECSNGAIINYSAATGYCNGASGYTFTSSQQACCDYQGGGAAQRIDDTGGPAEVQVGDPCTYGTSLPGLGLYCCKNSQTGGNEWTTFNCYAITPVDSATEINGGSTERTIGTSKQSYTLKVNGFGPGSSVVSNLSPAPVATLINCVVPGPSGVNSSCSASANILGGATVELATQFPQSPPFYGTNWSLSNIPAANITGFTFPNCGFSTSALTTKVPTNTCKFKMPSNGATVNAEIYKRID